MNGHRHLKLVPIPSPLPARAQAVWHNTCDYIVVKPESICTICGKLHDRLYDEVISWRAKNIEGPRESSK